jgi:1,4-alpha-glucan branching enzyme
MFLRGVREQLMQTDDQHRNMGAVAESLTYNYGPDAFNRVVFTESHDEVAEGGERITTSIDAEDPYGYFAIKRGSLGVALAATAPGIPMLFQGQEFCFHKGFDSKLDMALDWQVAENMGGMVQLCGDLLRARRNMWGESEGLQGHHIEMLLVDEEQKIIAFQRWQEGEGRPCVVVANFSTETRTGLRIPLPHAGTYKTIFNSDAPHYHEGFDGTGPAGLESEETEWAGKPQSALTDLAPYSVQILALV